MVVLVIVGEMNSVWVAVGERVLRSLVFCRLDPAKISTTRRMTKNQTAGERVEDFRSVMPLALLVQGWAGQRQAHCDAIGVDDAIGLRDRRPGNPVIEANTIEILSPLYRVDSWQ